MTRFKEIEFIGRRSGRTTKMAQAAIELGCKLMVHSREFGSMLEKQFKGLECIYFGSDIRGTNKPILVDHYCTYLMIDKIENEKDHLQDQVLVLQNEKKHLIDECEKMKSDIEFLLSEIAKKDDELNSISQFQGINPVKAL